MPGFGDIGNQARSSSQNIHNNFQLLDTITVEPSLTATIVLLPSSLGIKTGFTNEVSLVATLKNGLGNPVSIGSKVRFDQYPASGTPINGFFRIQRDTTDATLTATASFTAGRTPVGTTFYLKCTYIDPFGNPSIAVKDSVLITITN